MTADEMVALSKQYTFWSWSAQDSVNPIPMAKAEGVYFWDANGKRYIDMNSQLMCVNIGHGDRRVIKAIQDQAAKLVYAGPSMATEVRAKIGPLLAKHTPGDLNKFFFVLGGAEANENAIDWRGNSRADKRSSRAIDRITARRQARSRSQAIIGAGRTNPAFPASCACSIRTSIAARFARTIPTAVRWTA